jgi:5-methylcytosine-specific restriction endonuclease McrA
MSKTYSEKLRDPRWQKRRLEILNISQWKCDECGRADKTLEVHHCAYVTGRDPWDYSSDLLMSLCSKCHEWRQGREDAFRVALGRITRFLPKAQLEDEVWKILEAVSLRETERLAGGFS